MIDSTKKEVDKFGARVLKLAVINLGASRSVDGKKRVTNNTGALAKSLKYKIKQKRSGGKFTSGFDVQFYSDLDKELKVQKAQNHQHLNLRSSSRKRTYQKELLLDG